MFNFLTGPDASEWTYGSQVAFAGIYRVDRLADTQAPHIFTDIIVFVCLVVFILKLKVDQGQSRTTRPMRSILKDGIPHRDAVFHHRWKGDSVSSTR